MPSGQTGPPYWRYSYPDRQILFSAYHLNDATWLHYVGELRRRRPPWLHGYPSCLADLAAYMRESGADLGYVPRWITVGAENLHPLQETVIERTFGARPIQHYGLAEGCANVSECEAGSLHVDEDFAFVEFLPDRDGSYRVLGTGFWNPATALVRYDTGDLVRLGDSCNCGRPGRCVAAIDGRSEDYVVLADGTRVGRLDHAFKDSVHISKAQIHQHRPGELEIFVVRGPGYTERHETELRRELARYLGDETVLRFQYVEEIPSRGRKFRFVVSAIAGATMTRQGDR